MSDTEWEWSGVIGEQIQHKKSKIKPRFKEGDLLIVIAGKKEGIIHRDIVMCTNVQTKEKYWINDTLVDIYQPTLDAVRTGYFHKRFLSVEDVKERKSCNYCKNGCKSLYTCDFFDSIIHIDDKTIKEWRSRYLTRSSEEPQ